MLTVFNITLLIAVPPDHNSLHCFSIASNRVVSTNMSEYFVYILECSNGSFYTGYTTDLTRRYQEHCSGTDKCKYTRSFPPKRIAAAWQIGTSQSAALRLEKKIKTLKRSDKIKLIQQPDSLVHLIEVDSRVIGTLSGCHSQALD